MSTMHLLAENALEWAEPEWVLAQLKNPRIRLVECCSRHRFYERGHLPGACFLDWKTDLLLNGEGDEADGLYLDYLCLQRGISRDSLCVFYGEEEQGPAFKTGELFRRLGYRRGKILRGGKEDWIRRGFPLSWKTGTARKPSTLATAEIVSVRCYFHEW